MPNHTCTIDEIEYDVEFKITYGGCPSNGWDEPGEAPEIEIESVTFGEVDIPYHKGTADLYEKLETQIIEKFDFDDYYSDADFDG